MLESKIALEVEKFEKKVLREVPRGPPPRFWDSKTGCKKGRKKQRYVENRPDIDFWSILGRFGVDLGSILDLILKGSWHHVLTCWVCCWALVSVLRAPVAACSVAVLTAPFALLGLLSLCIFSSVVCFSGLRETLEAIPAQSAERGRGARLFVNCVLAAALPGQRGRFSGRA